VQPVTEALICLYMADATMRALIQDHDTYNLSHRQCQVVNVRCKTINVKSVRLQRDLLNA
jgi:hypothetical protein